MVEVEVPTVVVGLGLAVVEKEEGGEEEEEV